MLTSLQLAVRISGSGTSLTPAPRKLGEFAVTDPSSISLVLHTLGGIGGVAGALVAITKVLVEWAKMRARPLKLIVGDVSLELPGQAKAADIEKMIDKITASLETRHKDKTTSKKTPSRRT